MRIDNLELYKGRTFVVEFENGFKIYLHRDIIEEFGLKRGDEISKEELKGILDKSNFRRAYERAMYLLDYRDYSSEEMREKLYNTYPNEKLCSEVMDKLVEKGFIDDERYAKNLARKLIEIKKYGEYKVRFEMRRKGIDEDLIEETIEDYDEDKLDRIIEVIDKKYARYFDDEKGIKKAKAGLARMGYSYSDINDAVNQYFEDE